MTFYKKEIQRISSEVYANRGQLDTVISIRNYINHHYDTQLNLDCLSLRGYVSKFHLLRLFQKYYGQTPLQYLTDKRLEQARVLLKAGATVTHTCFAVGFESPSSFSTLFKNRTGLSPAQYQKKQDPQCVPGPDTATLGL